MVKKIGQQVIKSKDGFWPQYNYATITDTNPDTYLRVTTSYLILSLGEHDFEFQTIYELVEVRRPK